MRRRLRKKLRVGEFREMGFSLRFVLPPDLDEPAQMEFFDSFIGQAIEGNGLCYGGGCGATWDGFVAHAGRGTVTEQDRERVRQWLARHTRVSGLVVGTLVDAWHSD